MIDVGQSRFDQFTLLGLGNRIGGSTKCQRTAELNLDETQGFSIAHDQVDFSETAVIVALQANQAPCLEVLSGLIFVAQSVAAIDH